MSDVVSPLTPREVCTQLGVGPVTVNKLIQSGELASYKVGRARRIPVEAVEAFKREHTTSRPVEDRIRALVAESRASQGLPPVVEDPATLAKIAALLGEGIAATKVA